MPKEDPNNAPIRKIIIMTTLPEYAMFWLTCGAILSCAVSLISIALSLQVIATPPLLK